MGELGEENGMGEGMESYREEIFDDNGRVWVGVGVLEALVRGIGVMGFKTVFVH